MIQIMQRLINGGMIREERPPESDFRDKYKFFLYQEWKDLFNANRQHLPVCLRTSEYMSVSECCYMCMTSVYLGEMCVSMHAWAYASVCTCDCVWMYVCMNVCVCFMGKDGCSGGVIALGSW